MSTSDKISQPKHDHEPLRTQMRRYFTLNLRADQARTCIHHEMQQNRYMHIFHGPPYHRVEHWNRCLNTAKLDYEDAEKKWRRIQAEDEGGEVDVEFLEKVKNGADELERLLEGLGTGDEMGT